ncbi:MAG: 2-oxoacid:acceptor oxidoreductase subunit alpha [Desulfarculaceae bacterium]|jgi:2-oxoglutarate ferredoxin oxidoreductase subunit alpha
MARRTVNVLIGGEAGQGLATVGQVLAQALVRGGWEVLVTQSYHSRIRGGHNTMAVRASRERIWAPREEVDLLVALNAETIALHASKLSEKGLLLADQGLDPGQAPCLQVPFKELASGKFTNVAALGVTACLLGLELPLVKGALEKFMGKMPDEVIQKNHQTLSDACKWAQGQIARFEPLAAASGGQGRIMLNGNQAIALGAASAGVKFCSFYPMTPSTSIALTLIGLADRMGLVVEQAEDEIAAINMALGASYAGAPALVPTSGGGFALMTEGVSLAGMLEQPVVIALAMRPGPATGLPTRTEQGDLEFVLHAGHGEFPRAVFAPGSPQDCFYLTRKAFELAEQLQIPVFILTDQYNADCLRAVDPFEVDGLEAGGLPNLEPAFEKPYQRYAVTENGVSPRLVPGMGPELVVADSDEHTPDGHITEDLEVRVQMVDKRLRKDKQLRRMVTAPDLAGHAPPELLLVSWGSTKGAVREAVNLMREQGRQVCTCHFNQVWPLVPEQFLPEFKAAGKVVCVEGNATGQFARLLRRETGFEMDRLILRYDGLPFTPEYILRQLKDL